MHRGVQNLSEGCGRGSVHAAAAAAVVAAGGPVPLSHPEQRFSDQVSRAPCPTLLLTADINCLDQLPRSTA